MDYTYVPAEPAMPPMAEPAPVTPKPSGLRRTILTAAVAGLLLVGGGVAAVSAASPDPSAAPSTAPSGGTGAPPAGTPRNHSGSTADCPNMDGSGGTGSGGSGASPATPSAPAATPQT